MPTKKLCNLLLLSAALFGWHVPASANIVSYRIINGTTDLTGTFVVPDGAVSSFGFVKDFTIGGAVLGAVISGSSPLGDITYGVGASGEITRFTGGLLVNVDNAGFTVQPKLDWEHDANQGLNDFSCAGTTACDAQVQTTTVYSFQSAVPEPGTLGLFVVGLAGLGYLRRKKA